MEMLKLSHVEKHFGEKQVLKGVTLSVPEHTVFGFVGKNGAGKTTAMKLILGLLPLDKGEIFVNGRQVLYGNTITNRYVGYLPDVPEFYSYMTPMEYLCFCGEVAGMPQKERKKRSEELLCMVGLENETARIKGFSRGMKQRLGIAQALLERPRLLICDEPTSALDPVGRKEILDLLAAAKEQTTVLFSTHILSDVERICDEVAFLHHGEIVLHGAVNEVRKKKRGEATEIETEKAEDTEALLLAFPYLKRTEGKCVLVENTEKLPAVLHFIADRKMPVLRMERCETKLEELFMEVAGR